ncbi:MAG: aspartate/glutamate racemase family protein [Clostridia bacterium]|nr:aspartate/glutamate racemase family protein [Clostridia bacterium]
MKSDNSKLLGILGGLGPMSTAYFYEMITEHTEALCDQDHIDMIISSSATTPDRTGYILGNSDSNPAPRMIADAKKLVDFGADVIAIPCNTAHYFYSEVQENISVPIIHIVYETLRCCKALGAEKIGIMATDGTVLSNTYQRIADEFGVECIVPSADNQQRVMDIIYKSVKQGKPVDMDVFYAVSRELTKKGCDRIILGCTELSLIKRDHGLDSFYIDALEVLAWRSILFCGKKPVGFEDFCDEI